METEFKKNLNKSLSYLFFISIFGPAAFIMGYSAKNEIEDLKDTVDVIEDYADEISSLKKKVEELEDRLDYVEIEVNYSH